VSKYRLVVLGRSAVLVKREIFLDNSQKIPPPNLRFIRVFLAPIIKYHVRLTSRILFVKNSSSGGVTFFISN